MDEISLRFSQSQFDEFGRLSGDLNPIHVDPEFSSRTRFGATVAHGMLLLGVVTASIARRSGGEVWVAHQELRFPAPTFADVALRLRAVEERRGVVESTLETAEGTLTAKATTWLGTGPDYDTVVAGDSAPTLGRLSLGDEATLIREFAPEDTSDLLELVDDPNPLHRGARAALPPALLGGVISCLLGMELPGRGTNWLKQSYRFRRPVPVDARVMAHGRIIRLRPEKHLVDLAVECSVDGDTVMDGVSLVMVKDLDPDH